ncbi:glycosyltransferase, putative [Plasmodium knowlesi strain H]|uniref:UDP-N-acetylglucosamine transferase subunit ALG13 n=3 Tax=Plasmodium knowlesi TaxID=5850 RepID=A0A5K1VSE1_PLAKH|nr:UDP-N-acetylglucosamine transferase subunit ALG13, putative [Plasmodium knowlesi strain H]OTN68773.1 putative Glycosyltransferase [Plasmodium knowlesi]CAA9986206.1 UDP-N-acetylglucosamine transferase subunit ALG13, putative [Plasmodium knowlesi strain H]SBO25410.1 glycosyltransferase, putative [Plasmodium knowlesi strain H]SBO27698.1 glycosyltransferase, putative [Plasmodium knowlesi strain H]VVS75680.1 UDP-N-acetylglucosamine transferase subunit ALG13, putative [Plasmodium knowlesi strain |eukprot:XP_002257616.1 glycosyltransferase, putative [Plasmodium knowlesi strain H]
MEEGKDGRKKILFVTVGSYKFDDLIKEIDTEDFHSFLLRAGFAKMSMQIGEGTYEPKLIYRYSNNNKEFLHRVKFFRYKKDLVKHFEKADLILSHAGAGSTVQGLRMKKKMLIVVNDKLMDNHQLEFARFLRSMNYLEVCECLGDLREGVLRCLQTPAFVPFPAPRSEPFLRDLRAVMDEVA